jgi:hypothetical protein
VGVLYLCAHCANQFWPELWVQGWTIWLTGGNDPGRKLRGGPRLERQHSPWR